MRALPVSENMKLCPFRKKRIAERVDCWVEEFLPCLLEECAMWNEGCGLGRIGMINPTVIDSTSNESEPDSEATKEESQDDLQTARITVLEAKPTKTEGTVRAWCQFADGHREAVFAKNSTGKKVLESTGKELRIRYRIMSNNTVFAVAAFEVSKK